jgi:methanogenic corrinoid protein MtbC1
MTKSGAIAAQILETSAAGYASAASAMLMKTSDGPLPEGWGSSEWKSHLVQRILELASAVRVNQPALFARRINWLRKAVRARGSTDADLRAALQSIRDALHAEMPNDLVAAVEGPLDLALSSFDSDVDADEGSTLDASTDAGRIAIEYITACLEARTDDAIALILEKPDTDIEPADVYTRILLPAQREIGQLWHLGEVSISEERLVSETTKSVMTLIVNKYAPPADPEKIVVAASVAGNAHDIGLRALSDLFRLAGWRSIFLGANVPSVEIAHAAKAFDADLVILSATLTTQLRAMDDVIDKIRQIASETRILVGGLAFADAPDLWQQLGADAYAADIASAVEVGNSIVTRQ